MNTRTVPKRLSLLLTAVLLTAGASTFAQDQQPPPQQRGGADPSDDAFDLGSPPSLQEGLTEEEMWPAATAEGWKQPCLVRWQRNFDDALKVAHAENRPILVCVNMDGEIASEHFAGVRYREPVTAELMSRYVCVVASVYRHTPRDYDEEGRRVPCPRFGTVTCGEHIETERALYDKYFDGKRISPRHIVLDLEEVEQLDVYYSWDTATVFTTFRKGVENWPDPNEPPEPTLENLSMSAKVEYRELLEKTYSTEDRETKRKILLLLVQKPVVDQVEVLRTAIFGFDLELAQLARQALAKCETEPALDLIAEALKVPLEADDRELLLRAVARMGESSPRARTLAALHSGLSVGSRYIDAKTLEERAREYEANAGLTVDVLAREVAALAGPEEPEALLEFAAALLARAQEQSERRYAMLLFEDARTATQKAERLGAKGPKLDAIVAVLASEAGDLTVARERAVAAIEDGLLNIEDGVVLDESVDLTEASKARVLRLFAEARQRSIRMAYRNKEKWLPEWLSDVNAAYSTLAKGPYVDEMTVVDHYDFLRWIGGTPRANAVLDDALRRFPESPILHSRLRGRLLWEGGPENLESEYAGRLAREAAANAGATQLTWFAGYASIVAAEHHRRRSQFEEAIAAYDRAITFFERNTEDFPDGRDTCLHLIALSHAGKSRIALERGELDVAKRELLLCFQIRPNSAATLDGLGLSPVMTAKMLKAMLLEAGDAQGAEEVQAGMDALDPKMLEPPPSERQGSGRRGRRGGRRGGG